MPCHPLAGHQPNACTLDSAHPSFQCADGCKRALKGAKVQPGEALPILPVFDAHMAFRVVCPARFEKGAESSADTAEAGSILRHKMNSNQGREIICEIPHANNSRPCRMPERGRTPSQKMAQVYLAIVEGPKRSISRAIRRRNSFLQLGSCRVTDWA